jgi:hypothetical protein
MVGSMYIVPAFAMNNDNDVAFADSYQPALVTIYHDSSEAELTNVVRDIKSLLSQVRIKIVSAAIPDIEVIDYQLERYDMDYAVYVFNSNTKGMFIDGILISWEKVARLVENSPNVHHLFGIGNSERILDFTDDLQNLHTEKNDIIDHSITVLFSVTKIAELLANSPYGRDRSIGESLRKVIVERFSENVNELITKSIAPDKSTGERDYEPSADPRLTESWYEEIPQYNEEGEELEPILKLIRSEDDEESNYIPLRSMEDDISVTGTVGCS